MIDEINFNDARFEAVMAAGWIKDLESSDSRLHKEKTIEKALMAANLGSADAQAFLFNLYEAYNPYHVFGVRQVPETEGITHAANPWPTFWALLEALRTRTITGHRARDRIQAVAQLFDSEEWNQVARRVLIKDMRCGISEKTINKVVGRTHWRVPVFTCQLAQDSAGQPTKLRGIKRLEVKLDGVRILAVVTGDVVNLYSRNGKPMDNFPQVAEAIEANRRLFQHGANMGGRFVLDGEIVGRSFQELMKQAHRKSDARTEHMVYHVFDIVPLDDFERGFWNAPQHKRLALLDRAREALTAEDLIQVMPGMDVDLDGAEGHDIMRTVVDVEQGTGRNEGRLGALVCEGVDDGKTIRVNVGSGFSDELRDQLWQDHVGSNLVTGQVVEVRADAITQNQDGTYSMRFPRFKTFRGFEPGEKL